MLFIWVNKHFVQNFKFLCQHGTPLMPFQPIVLKCERRSLYPLSPYFYFMRYKSGFKKTLNKINNRGWKKSIMCHKIWQIIKMWYIDIISIFIKFKLYLFAVLFSVWGYYRTLQFNHQSWKMYHMFGDLLVLLLKDIL